MNKKLFVVPCYTVVLAANSAEVKEIIKQYYAETVTPDLEVSQEYIDIEKVEDIPEKWSAKDTFLEMITDVDGDKIARMSSITIGDILQTQEREDKEDKEYMINYLQKKIQQLQLELSNLKKTK